VPEGNHVVKYEFTVDSPAPGSGGEGALYIDDKQVARGRIPKTQPFVFSADEGADVGVDNETAVSEDYEPHGSQFGGVISKVTIDVQPAQK
jgi:hypothetical protein